MLFFFKTSFPSMLKTELNSYNTDKSHPIVWLGPLISLFFCFYNSSETASGEANISGIAD